MKCVENVRLKVEKSQNFYCIDLQYTFVSSLYVMAMDVCLRYSMELSPHIRAKTCFISRIFSVVIMVISNWFIPMVTMFV